MEEINSRNLSRRDRIDRLKLALVASKGSVAPKLFPEYFGGDDEEEQYDTVEQDVPNSDAERHRIEEMFRNRFGSISASELDDDFSTEGEWV